MRIKIILILLVFLSLSACAPAEETGPAYLNPDLPASERADDLLGRMTLAEKIGQMTLVEKDSMKDNDVAEFFIGGVLSGGGGSPDTNTPEAWANMVDHFQELALTTRLQIPLIYGVDAVHGHGNAYGAVIFPHNIGLGAAADPDLMEKIGHTTAMEMAATGIFWNYAPAVSVPQDIRWGRTYEGYSEDPVLVSQLSLGYLRGLQGNDLSSPDTVLATPKHFVGDGGTGWGTSTSQGYRIDRGDTDVDEATLRAIHLQPYPGLIEAGAQSIMISYSSWGETKMHAQKYLITDVLKGELGFEGFVVSDWAGIDEISSNYADSVVTAINAGIDMNMVPYDYEGFIDALTRAVEQEEVPINRIDDAVRRILTVKFELGLFEAPFSNPDVRDQLGSDPHREIAREAVRKSLVLLKNEGGYLPLSKDMPKIFVGGKAANDIGIQSGGWTIEWQGKEGDITEGTTILDGIKDAVSPETMVNYNRNGAFEDREISENDICLMVVGERPYAEGAGDDSRLEINVFDEQVLNLMEAACENLVVILISGRPLIISGSIDKWDSLVAAWLPGTEGNEVADVLFGDFEFTGKLPYTWPRNVDQLPFDFENLPSSGCEAPLFPRGYGLTTDQQASFANLDCAP